MPPAPSCRPSPLNVSAPYRPPVIVESRRSAPDGDDACPRTPASTLGTALARPRPVTVAFSPIRPLARSTTFGVNASRAMSSNEAMLPSPSGWVVGC